MRRKIRRTSFVASDPISPCTAVDQVLYGADVLGLEIEKEFGEITGTFPEISLRYFMENAMLFFVALALEEF